MKPGEENHVQIPEPRAPAGFSGNAQNAALTYSGSGGTASEGRRSVPAFKGLELSRNARVQDESSASQLPPASQGAELWGLPLPPCALQNLAASAVSSPAAGDCPRCFPQTPWGARRAGRISGSDLLSRSTRGWDPNTDSPLSHPSGWKEPQTRQTALLSGTPMQRDAQGSRCSGCVTGLGMHKILSVFLLLWLRCL